MKRVLFFTAFLFFLQVLWAQNAPVANNDSFTISNNQAVLLPVLSNDYDVDADPLTVSIHTLPLHGTASLAGNRISYLPNSTYTGTDSFNYIVCDTTNRCDTATVFILVIEGNASPVAVNDNYTVPEDVSTPLPVTGNDFDPEGDGLTVYLLGQPANGTASVSIANEVVYVPNPSYFGADSFLYTICDNSNDCDTATVYINVTGINSPPQAENDNYTFADTLRSVTLNVLENDLDPENDTLYVFSITAADSVNSIGVVHLDSATGNLVWVRNGVSCGAGEFRYVVCDRLSCDTAVITITVTCPDNVFLPEGFSPDGDGKNDRLVFTGLEYFAPASLSVFNRYGTIVYEAKDYKNDWDGTYIENSKPLPDGTYFYVLVLADKRKYNNYLVINR